MSVCIWESIGVVERGKTLLSATRQAARNAIIGFNWRDVRGYGLEFLSFMLDVDELAKAEAIGVATKAPLHPTVGNGWYVLELISARKSGDRWSAVVKVQIYVP